MRLYRSLRTINKIKRTRQLSSCRFHVACQGNFLKYASWPSIYSNDSTLYTSELTPVIPEDFLKPSRFYVLSLLLRRRTYSLTTHLAAYTTIELVQVFNWPANLVLLLEVDILSVTCRQDKNIKFMKQETQTRKRYLWFLFHPYRSGL